MAFSHLVRAVGAAVLAVTLCIAAPARADWLKAESPHFTVYGDTSEGALRDYVRKVERFDSVLRLYFPIQSDIAHPPLSIYLAEGRSEMRQIWPDMPERVGGFYTSSTARIFAVSGASGGTDDNTLFHEYAHHFMKQNFAAAYPAWFIEGFAEYFATADLTPGRVQVGLHNPGRMYSLTQGANSWVPMEDLLRSRSSGVSRGRGATYYAQAWALTNYMMGTPERQQALRLYLRAIAGGADPIEALKDTIGRTPEQLQSDLRSYLGRGITVYTLQVELPSPEIKITRMPPSTRDLIWLDLRLSRFVPEDLRAANLAEAQRKFDRYPGDPLAGRVLAQAYLDMQQPEGAIEALAPSLLANPDDAQALLMRANALMDQGDSVAGTDPARKTALYASARAALAKAYQADASDYRIYLALSSSREDSPGYPTDNDVETMVLASQLAPQVGDISVRTAQLLMQQGRYIEAIGLLAPVANNPHGGDGLASVKALLDEARMKAGLSATPAEAPPEVDDAETTEAAPT